MTSTLLHEHFQFNFSRSNAQCKDPTGSTAPHKLHPVVGKDQRVLMFEAFKKIMEILFIKKKFLLRKISKCFPKLNAWESSSFFFLCLLIKKIILLSFIYTQGSILGWLTELWYKYGRFLFEVGLTFNLSRVPLDGSISNFQHESIKRAPWWIEIWVRLLISLLNYFLDWGTDLFCTWFGFMLNIYDVINQH